MKTNFVINMPQMAIEALSENWLFKELGNLHWEMICAGLHTKSFDLKNDTGNRLYATFVRIRIRCAGSLKTFRENDQADLHGNISRFGNSMYFSEMLFDAKHTGIKAELMTTFSIRDAVDNTRLAKSEPDVAANEVEKVAKLPDFGNQYRLVKKGVMKELPYEGLVFPVQDSFVFETEYTLNPYYDLNGVNLLYFAAYPIINDVCEARFFNMQKQQRWEQSYYTGSKDIMYFANCNIDDTIIYQLNYCDFIQGENILISSTLRRKSDGAIIARIFSVKIKEF